MYRVVIKCQTTDEAEEAAKKHGVIMLPLRPSRPNHTEVWGIVPDSELQKIQAWFQEDLFKDAPFAKGALLYFSPTDQVGDCDKWERDR